MVGDVVGFTPLAEGLHGTDLSSGRQLSEVDRTSRILTGSGQLVLSGAILGSTYDPSATFRGSIQQLKASPKPQTTDTPPPAPTEMSVNQIKAARQRGVYQAKAAERELVRNGHVGTVKEGWNWNERKTIAETGQYPSDTRWHHINDVKRKFVIHVRIFTLFASKLLLY